jgi:hypothetical protein
VRVWGSSGEEAAVGQNSISLSEHLGDQEAEEIARVFVEGYCGGANL